MTSSSKNLRIGIAVAIILGTIGWLALTGYNQSKSYYVTISEMNKMGAKAYTSNLRVQGFVKPGSIEQNGTHVTFVLDEFESHSPKAGTGKLLQVNYKGSEPPPDTFKDDAQALAVGTFGRDGVFHASELQAKCASKYGPQQPGQPAMTPNKTASTATTPGTATAAAAPVPVSAN